MPQMAPMNWILLFAVFIMLMIIVLNKIYFLLEKKNNTIKINKGSSLENFIKWMW